MIEKKITRRAKKVMENLKKKKKKRRKMEDTGESSAQTKEEIRSLVECLPKPQLVYLLGSRYPSIAEEIKNFATPYVMTVRRNIFVNGLSYKTDSDALHYRFQAYGEIEKAVVVCDKVTGKFEGYGFVTYKDIK
ncbi:hypothetical protein RYX36_031048 [Vicia faba]